MMQTHAQYDVLMTPVKTRPEKQSMYELQSPVASPRQACASSPRTPNHPLLGNERAKCMSSPLRLVGRTSPCSVKLLSGCLSRIEGGNVTDFRTDSGLSQYQSPASSPRKEMNSGMYPRELSFANLLDNNAVADELETCGDTDEVAAASACALPASPRKRPRKHTPVRAAIAID